MHKFDVSVPVGDILLSYKPNLFISEFPTSTWLKIGKVVNLFMYPLLMGKECPVDECELTFDDMYMYRKDQLVTWDRLVWNSNICFPNELFVIISLI